MSFIRTSKTKRATERDARKRGIMTPTRKAQILQESGSDPRVQIAGQHYAEEAAKAKAAKKQEYETHPDVVRHRGMSKSEQTKEAVDLTAKQLYEFDKSKKGDRARFEDSKRRAEGYANLTERKASEDK